MNTAAKFGLAAAAVVVAAVLGFNYLIAPTSAAPVWMTRHPPASDPPASWRRGRSTAGTVVATRFGASESVTFRFTVPDGWGGFAGAAFCRLSGN